MTILFAPTFRGDGPRGVVRLRAARLRGAPRAARSSATRSSSSRCTRSCVEPVRIPEAFRDRLLDGSTRPPSTSTTCCSRSTSWSPTTRRSCSSTRPSAGRCCSSPTTSTSTSATRDFYVPFETFVPGRIVRTFAELLDAIRRDDYEVDKVDALRRPPFRPSRRRLDRSGHRPADRRPVSGLHRLTIRILLVRVGVRARPACSRSARGSCSRPRTRHGSAATSSAIRDDLAARHPEITGRRPRPPAGVGGLRGRLVAAWQALVAGYYLATSRVFIVDDYFFPIYVIRPRAGTTIIQTWHACGAFKKVGYSVLDKTFGADEALAQPGPDPLELRRLPGRLAGGRAALRRGLRPAARAVRVAARHPADRRLLRRGAARPDARGGPRALRPDATIAGSSSTRRPSAATRVTDALTRPTTSTSVTCATSWATTTSCSSGSIRSSGRGRRSVRTSPASRSTSPTIPTSTS